MPNLDVTHGTAGNDLYAAGREHWTWHRGEDGGNDNKPTFSANWVLTRFTSLCRRCIAVLSGSRCRDWRKAMDLWEDRMSAGPIDGHRVASIAPLARCCMG